MRVKLMAEVLCKQKAVTWGYEVFVSVDLDEYIMPTSNSISVMDELVDLFNATTRGMVVLSKLNFPPVPHILEPVNLLTIEAYQTRMNEPGKMNYYTSIAGKVALRLQGGPEYGNGTTEYVTHCCDFHGCRNFRLHRGCMALFKAGGWHIVIVYCNMFNRRIVLTMSIEQWKFDGKHRKWRDPPRVHRTYYFVLYCSLYCAHCNQGLRIFLLSLCRLCAQYGEVPDEARLLGDSGVGAGVRLVQLHGPHFGLPL